MQAAALYNDFGSLAGLRTQARRDAHASLREVASQFESLFVQMMLKAMRDATIEGGLFDSHQLDSYEQMYDQQLSVELSSRGGIGLADVLVEQLRSDRVSRVDARDAPISLDGPPQGAFPLPERRTLSRAAVTVQGEVGAPPAERPEAAAARAPGSAGAGMELPASLSPESFARTVYPLAQRAAARLGVAPEVLVAQAALETGWGRHMAADDRGSSNNLFNIKAGQDWEGRTVGVATLEYRDGVAVREMGRFRAYDSLAASVEDYAAFIEGSPRYAAALDGAAHDEGYLRELQRAGYATDPAYADKILGILRREPFSRALAELKFSSPAPLGP